jgi:DNA-binding transcriptional LysR family regulator
LPIARDLDRGFRAADHFGRAAPSTRPSLTIGVIRTISGAHLRQWMESLSDIASIALIEGKDSELRAALADGRADVALTLLRDGETGPQIFPLWTEAYQMLARPSHRLAGQGDIDPEALASEVMIARRSCELLDATSRFFAQRGVRPRFALRSEDDARCMDMVRAGLGITTAPLSLAGDDLITLPVTGYHFTRRLGWIMGANVENDPALHAGLMEKFAAFRDLEQSLPD